MPRTRRLTGSIIRRVKPHKRLHGAFFSLAVAELPDSTVAQYACVVSKKTAVRAVTRNTVKRRCRAAIRAYTVPLPPLALIFHAKREAAAASYASIAADVSALLRRVAGA